MPISAASSRMSCHIRLFRSFTSSMLWAALTTPPHSQASNRACGTFSTVSLLLHVACSPLASISLSFLHFAVRSRFFDGVVSRRAQNCVCGVYLLCCLIVCHQFKNGWLVSSLRLARFRPSPCSAFSLRSLSLWLVVRASGNCFYLLGFTSLVLD